MKFGELQMMNENKTQRLVYLEVLRVFAIVCVVFNHTRNLGYDLYAEMNDFSLTYYWSMASAIICKCAVPLFFMISGAVLLGKKESIKELYCKRISRIAIIMVVFIFLQYLRIVRVNGIQTFDIFVYLEYLFSRNVIEPYWYLPCYLGYLMILPFLRKMVQDLEKKDYLYLFALDGVFIAACIVQILSGHSINLPIAVINTTILYPLMGYFLADFLNDEARKSYILTGGGYNPPDSDRMWSANILLQTAW